MLRFSTKTNLEQENEEAERLVRESPKVKPPRHDKRRERLDVDKDPDLDDPDTDLSKNYKVIGGSEKPSSEVVVERFKEAKIKPHTKGKRRFGPSTKRKPPAPKPKEELITVRLKKDPSKVVQVTKKTLQTESNKYEEIKEKKKPQGKPSPEAVVEKSTQKPKVLKKEPKVVEKTTPEGPKKEPSKPDAVKEEAPKKDEQKSEEDTLKKKEKGRTPLKKKEKPDVITPKTQGVPGAPSRPYTMNELREARRKLITNFPNAASSFFALSPPLHPDEINNIVAAYEVAKNIPAKNIEDIRKTVSKVYTLDPNKVAIPETIENEKGEKVPFASLSKEEQDKAASKHRTQTIAMCLMARKAVAEDFTKKTGAPAVLADDLADFTLSEREDKTLSERNKRADQRVKNVFYKGVKAGAEPITDKVIEKTFRALEKDPVAQKLAVSYFQAQDYQNARKNFLDPKSKTNISEHQPPAKIYSGLSKALDYLREQSKKYPKSTTSIDTSIVFKERVLQHLSALQPEKAKEVQERLTDRENDYYEKTVREYEKASRAYKKKLEKAEKDFQKELNAQTEAGKDLPERTYTEAKDKLLSEGVFEPKPSIKPKQYDEQRNPEKLTETAKDMWDSFKRTTKTAKLNKIVSQYLSDSFSINNLTVGMKRNSVYWGVAPEKVNYPNWSQPQARDLTEKDFNRLLGKARDWLKSPVLATNIEGVVKDTQLRAALDLALRTEGYDHAIHPTVYNNLLSRLAGKAQDETLVTVKTARELEMSNKVEFDTTTADQLLARLDRVASTIQEKHEGWGMHFEAAKALVNEIDRIADGLETAAYGDKSLTIRQAQVIQRDADEGYMDTFKNPMAPVQTDADEPYMSAYSDDQSSAVENGKSSTGRPLAP